MSELKIATLGDGNCAECSQDKKGVGFRLNGQLAFLCWEHFRLLEEAMKPARTEVQRVVEIRSWDCCCHSCCCHHGRTHTRGYSVGRNRSHSISETSGESVGISETRTEGRSRSEGYSRGCSSGTSEGES